MRAISTFIVIAIMSIATSAFAQSGPDAIVGKWKTNEGLIEIVKKNDRFLGYPVKPDGTTNMGRKILDVAYDDKKWEGEVYSIKREDWFDFESEIEGSKMLVEVSAGFISKDFEWVKTK